MGNNAVSPYQQVIEKTKSLSFRSQMLTMNIEKKQAQSTKTEVCITHTVHMKCTQATIPGVLLKATMQHLTYQIAQKVNMNPGQFKATQKISPEQQG